MHTVSGPYCISVMKRRAKPSGMKPLPLNIQVLVFTPHTLPAGIEINKLRRKKTQKCQVTLAANVIFNVKNIFFNQSNLHFRYFGILYKSFMFGTKSLSKTFLFLYFMLHNECQFNHKWGYLIKFLSRS